MISSSKFSDVLFKVSQGAERLYLQGKNPHGAERDQLSKVFFVK